MTRDGPRFILRRAYSLKHAASEVCSLETRRINRRIELAEIKAPMGGKVVKVSVNVGDQIAEDDEVLVLEAMKMEMPILAEEDGTVAEVKVSAGQTVEAEQTLVVLN